MRTSKITNDAPALVTDFAITTVEFEEDVLAARHEEAITDSSGTAGNIRFAITSELRPTSDLWLAFDLRQTSRRAANVRVVLKELECSAW